MNNIPNVGKKPNKQTEINGQEKRTVTKISKLVEFKVEL